MSWSQTTRRVGYWGVLAAVVGLVYVVTSQTLATDHIALEQVSPNAVTATASQPVRNWNHVFSSSLTADCSSLSYNSRNDQTSASRTRTITWTTGSRRDGNYLCVRTLVDTAERTYAYSNPLRLDLAGPRIQFESGRAAADSLRATISDYSDLHSQTAATTAINDADVISGASFRYAMLRSAGDCSVRNLNLRTTATDVTRQSTLENKPTELTVNIPVAADNHDQYVCLKATDRFGNVSYQSSSRLDTEISRVRLSLSNGQVRITAGEVLSSVWGEARGGNTCTYDSLSSPSPTAQGVSSLSVSYDITTSGHGIVCFYLTDRQSNSAGYSYTLDSQPPGRDFEDQIQASQSGRVVVVTAGDNDQRDPSHQGDNDYPKDWGIKAWDSYFIDTSATTNLGDTLAAACSADNYGKSMTTDDDTTDTVDTWRAYDSRNNSDRLTLSSSHARYEAVCFRATDYSDQHTYGHHQLADYDDDDAVINSQRVNHDNEITLTISPTSKRVVTWRWAVMTVDQACGIALIPPTTAPTTSNEIPVTNDNVGGFFCVEALLSDNNHIYQVVQVGSSAVDDTPPTITASWSRNALQAAASDDLSGVKTTSWQWQLITDPDNAVSSCQPDENANPKITSWRRGANTGSFGTSRNGQFVCFRVSDNVGNIGYEHFEIHVVSTSTDTTRPTVNVRRSGQTVTASSTSSDLPSVPDWRYKISDSSACGDNSFDTNDVSIGYGNTVQLVDGDDVWVCFQVADSAGNLGYGKLKVDLRGPTISVSQSGSTVTATADEAASSWVYFQTVNAPAYCEAGDNWNLNRRQTVFGRVVRGLTAAHVGQWLCFRAQDAGGNQQAVDYQIVGPIGTTPATNPLTISFAQSPTQLVASANRAVASWRYLVYESAPVDCDSDNSYFDTSYAGQTNNVDLDRSDNGRYYCFQAIDANGVEGYGSHRVNLPTTRPAEPTNPDVIDPVSALSVTISRYGNRLTANANRDVASWRYLVYQTKPANCDDTNAYFAADNGRVGRSNSIDLVADDSGRYYCFQATDSNSQKGYGLYQVGTVTDDRPITTTPEDPVEPETPAEPLAVVVDLKREGNRILATANQAIASWHYLIYADKPNCDASNAYFDAANGRVGRGRTAPVTKRTVGYYYCFRAKTADNRDGYAVWRVTQAVDRQPEPTEPTPPEPSVPVGITFSRTSRHVVARSNQAIASWRWLIYAEQPNCDDTNTYFDQTNARVGSDNKAPWTSSSQARYYCFRAKTADGREGYAIYYIPAAKAVTINQPAQAEPEPEPAQPQPQEPAQPKPAETKPAETEDPAEAEQPAEPEEDPADEQPQTDNQPLVINRPATGDQPADPTDDDDDLPWAWIAGGVGAAALVFALIFWPRRRDDEDSSDHDDL